MNSKMNWCVVNDDNIIINIVVSNEAYAHVIGAKPSYDGASVGDIYDYPVVVPTPSELREQAYNTEAVIEWDGEMITVTQASQLWQYYATEGSEKASKLTALVAAAKQEIRSKYPD